MNEDIFIFLASFIVLSFLNFAFNLGFLGPILNLHPQQGQYNPSHFMNSSHIWQRFCPFA
jgi:hypothetical protein